MTRLYLNAKGRRVLTVMFVRVRVIRTPTTRDATQRLGY